MLLQFFKETVVCDGMEVLTNSSEDHFAIEVYQVTTLYTLNLHGIIRQLYLSQTGKEKELLGCSVQVGSQDILPQEEPPHSFLQLRVPVLGWGCQLHLSPLGWGGVGRGWADK